MLAKPSCCLKIFLMCLYILCSCTPQETSKVWHLLLGGRLIKTAAEYITVGMCVMFCQMIQTWFQCDFRTLLVSNIYFFKEAVNFRNSSLQENFWGQLSRNEGLCITADISFCPVSASATHPLRCWQSPMVSWHGAYTSSKVGTPV